MPTLTGLLELANKARAAKRECGTSFLSQLADFYALRRSPNLLGPSEYYEYRLYDPAISKEAKQTFIGYKTERIYEKLNDPSWHGTANDKILYEQVMRTCHFQIPRTTAIFHPWRTAGTYCKDIRTLDDLGRYLSSVDTFPLFVKPIHGLFGRGTNVIRAYDPVSNVLQVADGSRIGLRDFHTWLESNSRAGMLFQEMIRPAESVRKICGDRLSSVRMIVLCEDSGPRLFRANWKICTGSNIVDNTDGWKNGNVVAAVDHLSGRVFAAFRGVAGVRKPIDAHPDTGAGLIGIQVPEWDAMKAYVETAAKAFYGLRFQAWDIAATSEGVCGIEVNLATLHTVYATQLVSGQGFLDARFAQALESLQH